MRILKLIQWVGILLLGLFLTGCATDGGDTDSLADLKQLQSSTPYSATAGQNRIRERALQETGMSVGAQSGLYKRSQAINQVVDAQAKSLDRIYNFHAIVLDNHILPPVLAEGRTTLSVDNEAAIRLADRTYEIQQQARFVSAPPDWRTYLQMNYAKPDRPDNTLLPENDKERRLWDAAVTQGWEEGVKQADSIFADNLARLNRDYKGMVLYRILLAQNMVSRPHVEKTNLGVTGGGNDLRVNDQVLRITAMPALSSQPNKWKPAVSKKSQRKDVPY